MEEDLLHYASCSFNDLSEEEELDTVKLKTLIDFYIYTVNEALPNPDIVQKSLKFTERGPTKKSDYSSGWWTM